ncbi:hypothetical protein HQO83_12050 [Rhodococcus fascians]|nr:hypothetical protein [Rhodococcus fascians]
MSYPGSGDPSERAYGQYGAQPNPSDRVIPPPGYAPETADPRPGGHPPASGRPLRAPRAAAQPNGPAQPHFGAQPNGPAQPGGFAAAPLPPVFPGGPPPQKENGGLWIVVAVLVAVALILGGVFAWLTLRGDSDPSIGSVPAIEGSASGAVPGSSPTGAQEPGVTTLPAGAQTCPATVASTSGLRGSAVGSAATSCPFAEEVRLAYTRGGSDRNSRTVVASSPVTGKRYEMNCVSSAQLVTCTGGENAVVYLF